MIKYKRTQLGGDKSKFAFSTCTLCGVCHVSIGAQSFEVLWRKVESTFEIPHNVRCKKR